jgi:hypothetical protein
LREGGRADHQEENREGNDGFTGKVIVHGAYFQIVLLAIRRFNAEDDVNCMK